MRFQWLQLTTQNWYITQTAAPLNYGLPTRTWSRHVVAPTLGSAATRSGRRAIWPRRPAAPKLPLQVVSRQAPPNVGAAAPATPRRRRRAVVDVNLPQRRASVPGRRRGARTRIGSTAWSAARDVRWTEGASTPPRRGRAKMGRIDGDAATSHLNAELQNATA